LNAPFIMKIRFFLPDNVNKIKNVKHIDYIAKKPEAEIKNDLDLEKELERELLPGINNQSYIKYISQREDSHGLFSDQPGVNLETIQSELKEHPGIVWRNILSLREDDAIRVGYDNREAWESMIKSQVYTATEKMGIERSNLRWVAAFHAAKGHPHVHLVFWEKISQRTRGKINETERREMKKVFSGEVFREERLIKMQEKTAMRDYIRENAQGNVSKAKELLRNLRQASKEGKLDLKAWGLYEKTSLPPELTREKELATKLHSLAQAMPGKGRAVLKFMPPEVKAGAIKIADWILQQPDFKQQIEKHQIAAESLARTYTRKGDQLQEAREKAYSDIRDRVANIVIRAGAELNKVAKQEQWDHRTKNISTARTARICWKSAWQAIERERVQTEAQAELEKRRMVAKEQAQKLKEKYKGKDYQDKGEEKERM